MSLENTLAAVAFAEEGEAETAKQMATPWRPSPSALKAIGLGALSLAMYVALFLFEEPLLQAGAKGHEWVALPVAIAFAFSTVHGAFTGSFWDALGLRARGK